MNQQTAIDIIRQSRRKLKSARESLQGYPGLVRPNEIRHEIMVSKEVINRMKKYLRRTSNEIV